MSLNQFPAGWDEKRTGGVMEYYENQTEDEAIAEDEAALENKSHTFIQVPNDLLPLVRQLIAEHQKN